MSSIEPNLPSILDHNGVRRYLGTHPTPPSVMFPMWADANEVLPASELVEFSLASTDIKTKDQDGRGACDGHAAASSFEWVREIAGYPYVALSAWMIYSILCNGVDRGASIGDALTLLTDHGTCPEALVPYNTINPRLLTREAIAACPRFKIEVGKMLQSYDEMLTATLLRRPGNFSIHVGGNFNSLDSDGCPPVARGAGNHAVTFGLGLKKARNGEWLIECQNSWGERWGIDGRFFIRRGHIEYQSYFEAYEIVAATDDPQGTPKPPVMV
jgi:hypothetical protein